MPAQVMENPLAALAGKHQVENDRIINALLGEVGTRFPIGGMIHRQPGFAQGGNNVFRQPLLVFDQEYAHEKIP